MNNVECDERQLRLVLNTALAHYQILLHTRAEGPLDEGDMKAQIMRIEECLATLNTDRGLHKKAGSSS
jgi:hypothetical protein